MINNSVREPGPPGRKLALAIGLGLVGLALIHMFMVHRGSQWIMLALVASSRDLIFAAIIIASVELRRKWAPLACFLVGAFLLTATLGVLLTTRTVGVWSLSHIPLGVALFAASYSMWRRGDASVG